MADTLLPIALPPGFRNTGTVYQSKGRWYTGNLVRFFGGTIQPVGGWIERDLSGATISGIPRAMVSYRKNDDVQIIVIGTTRGLYAISNSTIYDITPSEVGSNNVARVWQLDVFGAYLVAVDYIAPNTTGAMYYWAGDTAATGELVSPWSGSNPTLGLSVVTTPERFLVMLGGKYTASGWSATGIESQSRMVTWATQEGGFTGSDWVPASTNTAGDFTLTTDGALVCGRRSRGTTLLWTTTDLWTMTYIGGQLVYRFDQAGNKCGIISNRAAIVTDAAAYWMGYNGFYLYDGFVKPMPCDVQDYVFGSLNRTYVHYIWAIENPTFGEVTWFYPSASATEVDRYVTYNYRENHWTTGSLERTAGITNQPGTHVYPVMCDSAATVFNHETGYFRYPEGTPRLESGPIELGNGDTLMQLQRIIPDDRTEGDMELSVFTSKFPDETEVENGPYAMDEETSVRLTARQIRLKFTEVNPLDDISWTARTPATAGDTWNKGAYSASLDIFAVVGTSASTVSAMSSPDGVTWTSRTLGTATQLWYPVIWVPELAMFIAGAASTGSVDASNIATSTNGTSWTARDTASYWVTGLVWAPSIPLAVGMCGNEVTTFVMTSTNGTAWTATAATGIPAVGKGIAWSPSLALFVMACAGNDTSTQIATSANGTAWTARTGGSEGQTPLGALWAEGIDKFAVWFGEGLALSSNGTSWTYTAHGISDFLLVGLSWISAIGRFVGVGYDGDESSPTSIVIYSEDGVTWTSGALAEADNLHGLAFSSDSSVTGPIVAVGVDAIQTATLPERDWRIGTVRLGVRPSSRR